MKIYMKIIKSYCKIMVITQLFFQAVNMDKKECIKINIIKNLYMTITNCLEYRFQDKK